jgi:hypothetical protein
MLPGVPPSGAEDLRIRLFGRFEVAVGSRSTCATLSRLHALLYFRQCLRLVTYRVPQRAGARASSRACAAE